MGAHFFGTALFPESKAYRLLADILNDASIALETLSPLIESMAPLPNFIPVIRNFNLFLSSALRALCGVVAGGSKSALMIHFATPLKGVGDLGELNAKDASKETVLALCGMLLGTLVVPYATTAWSTYTLLSVLIIAHLAINYIGIRGVVLRTLNRQRTGIAWTIYRSSKSAVSPSVPTPAEVASLERILEFSGVLRDASTGRVIGHCSIGSSLSSLLQQPLPPSIWSLFENERFLLWFDSRCLRSVPGSRDGSQAVLPGPPQIHICLKTGHTPVDHLKAWAHAMEVARLHSEGSPSLPALKSVEASGEGDGEDEVTRLIRRAYHQCVLAFPDFLVCLREAGWNPDASTLITRPSKAMLLSLQRDGKKSLEKKNE